MKNLLIRILVLTLIFLFLESTATLANPYNSSIIDVIKGTAKYDIVTDKSSAIKGPHEKVSDSYTNEKGRTTSVTGESSYGINVKAGDGTATGSFGSHGVERGYSEEYEIKAVSKESLNIARELTKEELDRRWFDAHVWHGELGEKILEKMEKMSKEDIGQTVWFDTLEGTGPDRHVWRDITKDKGKQTRKHVKDYYVQWNFYNMTTGEKWSYEKYSAPMDELVWKFDKVGSYKVVSTPWSKWDVGHYEYYTITVIDENKEPHTVTRSRWVHEYYEDDWHDSAQKTYYLTISIDDLGKEVRFPITKETTVIPVDELVK